MRRRPLDALRRHVVPLCLAAGSIVLAAGLAAACTPEEALVDASIAWSPVPVTQDDLPRLRDRAALAVRGLPRACGTLGLALLAAGTVTGLAERRDRPPAPRPPATRPAVQWTRRDAAAACVLLLSAGALSCVGIARPLLWDEAANHDLHLVLPLRGLLTTEHAMLNHLGFSVLAWLSIHAFGDVPWAARLPSAVAGAVLAPGAFVLLRRTHGFGPALATAALMLLWPDARAASLLARGYALMLAAMLAMEAARTRWLRTGSSRAALAWAVALGVGMTFHVWLVLAAAATCLTTCLLAGSRAADRVLDPTRRRVVAPSQALAAALAGAALGTLLQAGIAHKLLYMLCLPGADGSWMRGPGMGLRVLAASAMGPPPPGQPLLSGAGPARALIVIAAASAVALAAWRARRVPEVRLEGAYLLVLLLTLVAAVAATRPVHAEARYVVFACVPWLLFTAHGWDHASRRPPSTGISAPVV